jgi:arginine decarboxylase
MEIFLNSAIGKGKTALSAFDDALMKAGMANYNLIQLSSIIPLGAKMIKRKLKMPAAEFGYKLYAVYRSHSAAKGNSVWTGLGWVQRKDGRGVFVEHNGESKKEVEDLIEKSLNGLKQRRGWKGVKNQKLVVGGKCKKDFICALVIAAYQSEGWLAPF